MVIRAAENLGREVGKTEEWRNYKKAKEALERDKELLRTIGLLEEKKRKLDEKLSGGGPVEVEEKREVRDLEEKLGKSKVFADYISAQNEYLELMRKVDEAITKGMEEQPKSKKKQG